MQEKHRPTTMPTGTVKSSLLRNEPFAARATKYQGRSAATLIRANGLRKGLLPQVEQHLPEAVRDFRNCRDTVKRHHGRQSYKLMLALWMQGNVDPYAHLSKHLTSEELAAALSLPHQSSVQVDYIISRVDRTSICDEELRKLIYRLFKVTDPNDDRASL